MLDLEKKVYNFFGICYKTLFNCWTYLILDNNFSFKDMVAAPPVGFNLTFVCPDGQVLVHYSVRLDLLLIGSSPGLLIVISCLLNSMTPILRIKPLPDTLTLGACIWATFSPKSWKWTVSVVCQMWWLSSQLWGGVVAHVILVSFPVGNISR